MATKKIAGSGGKPAAKPEPGGVAARVVPASPASPAVLTPPAISSERMKAAFEAELSSIIRRYAVPAFRAWLAGGSAAVDKAALAELVAKSLGISAAEFEAKVNEFLKTL